jgi:hypothetical protein
MPRRIIGQVARKSGQSAVADEVGIGCMQEYISFQLGQGKNYLCDKEKNFADRALDKNSTLWPAVVIFPTGLHSDLIYAQCTFPLRPGDKYLYKEASGVNNFLRPGRLIEFIREYNVSSLMVSPTVLAGRFFSLKDPRIEESLFVLENDLRVVPYEAKLRVLRAETQAKTEALSRKPHDIESKMTFNLVDRVKSFGKRIFG